MKRGVTPICALVFSTAALASVPAQGEGCISASCVEALVTLLASDQIIINLRQQNNNDFVISINHEQLSLEDLSALMKGVTRAKSNLVVSIRCDADIAKQKINDVISTCVKAGVSNFSSSNQIHKALI